MFEPVVGYLYNGHLYNTQLNSAMCTFVQRTFGKKASCRSGYLYNRAYEKQTPINPVICATNIISQTYNWTTGKLKNGYLYNRHLWLFVQFDFCTMANRRKQLLYCGTFVQRMIRFRNVCCSSGTQMSILQQPIVQMPSCTTVQYYMCPFFYYPLCKCSVVQLSDSTCVRCTSVWPPIQKRIYIDMIKCMIILSIPFR